MPIHLLDWSKFAFEIARFRSLMPLNLLKLLLTILRNHPVLRLRDRQTTQVKIPRDLNGVNGLFVCAVSSRAHLECACGNTPKKHFHIVVEQERHIGHFPALNPAITWCVGI